MSSFTMLTIFYWAATPLRVLELSEREKKCPEGLRRFLFDGRQNKKNIEGLQKSISKCYPLTNVSVIRTE